MDNAFLRVCVLDLKIGSRTQPIMDAVSKSSIFLDVK